jgi:hypothetical protein
MPKGDLEQFGWNGETKDMVRFVICTLKFEIL